MTPQPQQYIITEDEVLEVEKIASKLMWTVRSRTAPSKEHNMYAERECAINNCMRRDWMDRHDAAIAAQAREKVLDIFDEFLNSDDHLTLYKWEVRERIRTLRTEGGEPR